MNFYKDKNVLVTGGNGFIGSFVVERLLKDAANVSIASRTQKNFLTHVQNDVKFVKCDLLNKDDVGETAIPAKVQAMIKKPNLTLAAK